MNDTLVKMFNICNFWDTVQGLFFINILVYFLDKKFDPLDNTYYFMRIPRWVFKLIEVSTYIMDLVDLSAILQGVSEHGDSFNKGKITGKVIKILL